MSEPESILNKATSFANRDLNMNHFPIRAENLFQRIFSDIRVKATNKNLTEAMRPTRHTFQLKSVPRLLYEEPVGILFLELQ